MAYQKMENTYLALLPFELQDLIFKKVVREQKKHLHAELIHELSNEVQLGKVLVSENPTKYKMLLEDVMDLIVEKFDYSGKARWPSSYSKVYTDAVNSIRRINSFFIIYTYGWAVVMDANSGAIDSRALFMSRLMDSIMEDCFGNVFITKNYDQMLTFENRLTSLSYQELLEYKKTIHYENNNKYGINN